MHSLLDKDFDGVDFVHDYHNLSSDLQKENKMGVKWLFKLIETYHIRGSLLEW